MVYVLLAEGFEEMEAFAPVDFLRRCGLSVVTVSLSGNSVTGAHGITVSADISMDKADFSQAKMVILPGGMPGTLHLDQYAGMDELLSSVYASGGYLAAICAAPMVLGKRGYLQGKEGVCYPGFEEYLSGATLSSASVVKDGRIITAKSAGVAWQFGYVLGEILSGKEVCENVRESLFLPSFGV